MNFSISEILLILLIALLVLKPEQLPDAAYSIGQFVKTIRRMLNKVKDEMNDLIDTAPTKKSDETQGKP